MTSCLQCGHEDPGGFVFCPRCGTKAVEPVEASDPLLGRTLNGKYRIETEIGVGAMGTVYLGEHIGLRKKVALKVLHPDLQVGDESLQRFQREGIAAGKFNHPHAIQIFDFDKSEGRTFYLAMEYVDGVNLGLFLRRRGKFPFEDAVELGRQLLSCLAEAHRHGIVHRDLKPDNIMVVEDARGDLRIKVLDFGLSKLVDRRLGSSLVTQPGRLLGTPLYMAPEQVSGEEADARSDIYAAGLILYEMLAGVRPFRDETATQLFMSRLTQEAPSLAADHPELGIPPALDDLLVHALQRERNDRFQTAEEMLQALDDVALNRTTATASTPSTARLRRVSPPPRPQKSSGAPPPVPDAIRGPRRLPLYLLGLLVAVAGGYFGVSLLRFPGKGEKFSRVRSIPAEERSDLQGRYVSLLDQARVRLQEADPTAALAAVNEALLLDCRDGEGLLVRADVYHARGDDDTAIADYRAALGADPSFTEAWLGIGWIHFERQQWTEAEESFNSAAALASDSGEVLAARGALSFRRGDLETARDLLERAVQVDPPASRAYLWLGRLRLDQGDVPGAIESLVHAKRTDTRSARALAWLGEAYLAAQRLDDADAQLAEALRIDPDAVEVRVQRASLLIERGRTDEALPFLAESIQRLSGEGRLWILRGVALKESGQIDEAIGALQRAFDLGARDAEARCLLGILYHGKGLLAEARAQYQAVLQQEGDYPLANLNLGLVLFAQQDYARAAERLERALAFDEGSAPAHFHLGLLYKDYLGDRTKAAVHLRRYLQLGGQDARVQRWLDGLQ